MIKGPGFQSHPNCHLLASCLTLTKPNLGKFYDLEVRSFEQLVPMTWQWLEFCTSASWQDSRQVLRRSFLKQSMELSSCLQVLLCFQWDPDERIVGHGKRTLDQLPDAGTPKKCEKPRNRISLIHWLDFSISQDGLVMLHKKQLHLHGRLKKKKWLFLDCAISPFWIIRRVLTITSENSGQWRVTVSSRASGYSWWKHCDPDHFCFISSVSY